METRTRVFDILSRLRRDEVLAPFIDDLPMPKPFVGTGDIRLIILGQDPTVKNQVSRESIKTVLNLDKKGSIRTYVERICSGLELELDKNVYATNVVKNFFTDPPTQITQVNVLKESASYWVPLLKSELDNYRNTPIISLGEPVLELLVKPTKSLRVRDYWGFTKKWREGENFPFTHIEAEKCTLHRPVYPFPHQPSISKAFYADRLDAYIEFVKKTRK